MNLDSETPPENGRHLRLLLVEDNPGDARLIAELLKEVPHRTYAIEHAERLDEIAAKPAVPSFDAVLLDLGLPDSQGIETYHAARQILPDVPIILLTGLDDDGIAEKSLRAGAQDYLVKGKIMDPYLLDRTVRHARERYRMQLQLEENARQLKLSEDRLQHIIEDHSGGILVLDEQHTVVYANHSAGKILGQERESLLRQPFAYCTDSHNCNEINFTKPTGEIVVVEIRTIKTEWNGEPAFLVCLEDITDRKRMMEQLIQQQKKLAVAQLSAGIAHEFNNILGVIKLSAEMLMRNRDLDREFKEGLARICRGSGRAGSLVKQLLIFTRTQKLSLCPIDVHETICNLQDLIEKILGPNSRLHLSTTSQAVTVQADRSALEQAILNIALNARDAMPQGGDLFIEDGSKERTPPHPNSKDPFLPRDHAFISIRDTGHGMTEEIRKRIFEPFFTTRQPDKGTGLGLSTVYGIVEEHKGWIEVESQVDHGSTFEIFLPLSAKARPPEGAFTG